MKPTKSVKVALKEIQKCEDVRIELEKKRLNNNIKEEEVWRELERLLSVRITKVTGTVLEFREKILKNKALVSVLRENNIRIEAVALVEVMHEGARDFSIGMDQNRTCYWKMPHVLTDPESNEWNVRIRYAYGSLFQKVQ